MNIWITMYKNGMMIGNTSFLQNNTVSTYTPFAVNINYWTQDIPDSVSINIQAFNREPRGNSVLYIDNLNFDGFLSGLKETVITDAQHFNFNVYPNPFNEQATLVFSTQTEENVLVRLFDITGKQVALIANKKFEPGDHQLSLSSAGLSKGFYFCVINNEHEVQSRKLIIY
jgi:hypothetical protein